MTTYARIRRRVLELIDQYSVAGETISLSYNGQSDFVHRIPGLIDQALVHIRTGVLPLRTVCRLGEGTALGGGWIRRDLPGDLWRIVSGGVRRVGPDGPVPVTRWRLQGRRAILTPPGVFLVEYDRYPEQLPDDPPDEYELPEDPEVLDAACLYAAAGLVLREDEALYAALRNEYEDRLSRMVPGLTAETAAVLDVYQEGGAPWPL